MNFSFLLSLFFSFNVLLADDVIIEDLQQITGTMFEFSKDKDGNLISRPKIEFSKYYFKEPLASGLGDKYCYSDEHGKNLIDGRKGENSLNRSVSCFVAAPNLLTRILEGKHSKHAPVQAFAFDKSGRIESVLRCVHLRECFGVDRALCGEYKKIIDNFTKCQENAKAANDIIARSLQIYKDPKFASTVNIAKSRFRVVAVYPSKKSQFEGSVPFSEFGFACDSINESIAREQSSLQEMPAPKERTPETSRQ